MKKTYFKVGIFLSIISISPSLFSQSVGMNSSGATPSSNAVLDLNTGNTSLNQGLLVPHVELGSSLTTFGLAGSATAKDSGMLIYNSNSIRQPVGYYYWNGGVTGTWTAIGGGGASWLLTGNAGTSPGTNFLGTTDGESLEFAVDGQKAGWLDYTAYQNTAYGVGAANTLNTLGQHGSYNIAIGVDALYYANNQSSNIAIGDSALYSVGGYTGSAVANNVAIGNSSLFSTVPHSTSGYDNTAIGHWTMRDNTSGYMNTASGYSALYSNTTGIRNTANGVGALSKNTTASSNTALGYVALYNNTADANTAVGDSALESNTSGAGVTAVGYQAAAASTTASNITAIGYQTLVKNTGISNTGEGYKVLAANTTGTYSTAGGYEAMNSNTTGGRSTVYGTEALFSNTTGSSSAAFGLGALYNSTGSWNTGMGDSAGYSNTSGTANTYLGYQTSGTGQQTNATAIGNGATVSGSNVMQMGNLSVIQVMSSGNNINYNPTTTNYSATTNPIATSAVIDGYVTSTGGAITLTLPTLANITTTLQGGLATAPAKGTSFWITFDNTAGTGTLTIAVNTGITTIAGSALTITGDNVLTIGSGGMGVFKLIYTSGTAAKLIRIGG